MGTLRQLFSLRVLGGEVVLSLPNFWVAPPHAELGREVGDPQRCSLKQRLHCDAPAREPLALCP